MKASTPHRAGPVLAGMAAALLFAAWVLFVRRLFPPGLPLTLIAAAPVPILALPWGPLRGRPGPGPPAWAVHLMAILPPSALLWALNHQALASWWTRDDPCLLRSTIAHGVWPHFLDPMAWRSLSGSVLMPWLNLSLGVDFDLAGLDPGWFYLHQLLSFCLLIAVAHLVLRTFLSPLASALALCLFVASVPSLAVAQQLMNRHYIEGLVLFLGSVELYRRSVVDDRPAVSLAGGLLYFLAATAKEVFVPLAALLPLLPFAELGRRLRHAVPFAAAAGAYAVWRVHMLGWSNSMVGYGTRRTDFAADDLLALPAVIGLGRPWHRLAALCLLAAAVAVLWRHRRWTLGLAVGLSAALVAPLAPLLPVLEPRHFFLPVFFASLAVGGSVQALSEKLPRRHRWALLAGGLGLLAASLGLLSGATFWRHHPRSVAHYRAEGSFILDSEADGVLLTTLDDTTFLSCTASLRQLLGRRPGPGFCGDRCWCSAKLAGTRAWRYGGPAVGVTAAGRIEEEAACRSRQPLRVTLRYDGRSGSLTWELGPHAEGGYSLLLVSDPQRPQVSVPYPLPRQGRIAWLLLDPLRFVVRYESPEGWQTYSPMLTLEAATHDGSAELLWEAREEAAGAM